MILWMLSGIQNQNKVIGERVAVFFRSGSGAFLVIEFPSPTSVEFDNDGVSIVEFDTNGPNAVELS